MGVRIQELPETTGINKEDLLIVEDGQGTKKGTVQQLDEALGVSQLKEDKITKPSEPPTTGKILRVKSVNEDGTFVCEWADCGGSNLDVKVDGKSICGLQNIANYLLVKGATETDITNRLGSRSPIISNSIDLAVKSAMCDGKGATWTDAERLACLLRIGCTVDESGFVKWTAQEVTE